LPKLREPEAFPGWFRRIVFKHCDRVTRHKAVQTVPLDTVAGIAASEDDPAHAVEQREMQAEVLAAIRSLPEYQRTTTTLFYINGYSQRDIAEFLEVPVTTVKKRLYDSRKKLKERMIGMVDQTLKSFPLPDDFAGTVKDLLGDVKSKMMDYLPEDIRELAETGGHELEEVKRKLLASLTTFLFADLDKLELGKKQRLSVSDMTPEQRDYLRKTLQKIDFIQHIQMKLQHGSCFGVIIEHFDSMKLRAGLYNWPGREWHNTPYIKFVHTWPSGKEHSIQVGPIEE
jgi:RNA polymerase sigma factor (sigma-70 family)